MIRWKRSALTAAGAAAAAALSHFGLSALSVAQPYKAILTAGVVAVVLFVLFRTSQRRGVWPALVVVSALLIVGALGVAIHLHGLSALACVYWPVALAASCFYGWKAVELFTQVPSQEQKPPPAWWWHQRWLNFAGAFVGWIALWVVGRKLLPYLLEEGKGESNFTAWDVLIGFIAFVGITGYLPFTVVGIISGASLLASKAGEILKDLMPKSPKGDS